MNKYKLSVIPVLGFLIISLSTLVGKADQYGGDAITDLFSGLWNSFWPLIALFFIVGIIMYYFGAPGWLKKVFGLGGR